MLSGKGYIIEQRCLFLVSDAGSESSPYTTLSEITG
jgi:hypothetical protein